MLLHSLGPAHECAKGYLERDRRAVVHRLDDAQAACSPLSIREHRWARVRTVSANGVRLLVGTSMQPGTGLVIDMKSEDSGSSCALAARVVGTRMQQDGNWMMDCRLLTRLTEEQVRALL